MHLLRMHCGAACYKVHYMLGQGGFGKARRPPTQACDPRVRSRPHPRAPGACCLTIRLGRKVRDEIRHEARLVGRRGASASGA